MMINSLPPIPTAYQINRDGEEFGKVLVNNTTPVERRFICEYGQLVLGAITPTSGQTIRFFRELADLAQRMPGYSGQVARMSLDQGAISRLQRAIAAYVTSHDAVQGAVS